MRFALIAAEKANYPVTMMCAQLDVSPSGFYASSSRSPSPRRLEDDELGNEVAAAHKASKGRYGSPRVMHHLRRKGLRLGRKVTVHVRT